MNTTARYPGSGPEADPERDAQTLPAFCPVCAARMRRKSDGQISCDIAGPLPQGLAETVLRAVAQAEPPHTPTHEPRLASFVWCPNCTTELQRQQAGGPIRCVICGLAMAQPDDAELAAFRASHRDPAGDTD